MVTDGSTGADIGLLLDAVAICPFLFATLSAGNRAFSIVKEMVGVNNILLSEMSMCGLQDKGSGSSAYPGEVVGHGQASYSIHKSNL